jgi:hypothetical protein
VRATPGGTGAELVAEFVRELTSSPWPLKPGDSWSGSGMRHRLHKWLTLQRRPNGQSSTSRHPLPQGQNVPGGVHVGIGLTVATRPARRQARGTQQIDIGDECAFKVANNAQRRRRLAEAPRRDEHHVGRGAQVGRQAGDLRSTSDRVLVGDD